jgi:hypothetical protein
MNSSEPSASTLGLTCLTVVKAIDKYLPRQLEACAHSDRKRAGMMLEC